MPGNGRQYQYDIPRTVPRTRTGTGRTPFTSQPPAGTATAISTAATPWNPFQDKPRPYSAATPMRMRSISRSARRYSTGMTFTNFGR
jgi:hypothetical protein